MDKSLAKSAHPSPAAPSLEASFLGGHEPDPYEGDAVLFDTLTAAGVVADVAALRSLVAGVLASADGGADGRWMELVLPEVAAGDLAPARRQLEALRRHLAASPPGGKTGAPLAPAARLAALQKELAAGGLDGFIIPRTDAFQGEFVPGHAQRLAWLTGFTGSAGCAVVLGTAAAIFVDGRYTLQVREEVDPGLFTPLHLMETPPAAWIAAEARPGMRIGIDPWLHSENEWRRLAEAAEGAGATLVAVEDNPVDAVWPDQPPPPLGPVVPHDLAYAGKSAAEKRRQIARTVAGAEADAALLTAPDSVAWLLNIRGHDVPRTPLPLSFALIGSDGAVRLFIEPRKLTPAARRHLKGEAGIEPFEALGEALDVLGAAGMRVMADPASDAAWVFRRLEAAGARLVRQRDPCQIPKACKNDAELAGARAAHRRDGAALSRFLAWLARQAPGSVSEMAAAERLRAFRFEGELIRDLSFETISGAGPNGAIVHYRVSPESNRFLAEGELYLVDSGDQYLDGTTDVTRTVAIGTPDAEQRDRFTRVLKGHIAVAAAVFPEGTSGAALDPLARLSLWQAGVDFDHGTGHGVGSYLGVHEGPQRISKAASGVALMPGMIVSDEPGYYKTGAYGIRIENLLAVVPAAVAGGERQMLGFETLTLAPIDQALIVPGMMTAAEIAWVNAYHQRVRETLLPLIEALGDREACGWLTAATAPLTE